MPDTRPWHCPACSHEERAEALFCSMCGRAKPDAANGVAEGAVVGDRYRLISKLGGGAHSTVFRAEHTTLGRNVALKVLDVDRSKDDLGVERFRREATNLAQLDNPHIAEIYDFGWIDDSQLYLAMELIEGTTLEEYLRAEGRLDALTCADILEQLCDALVEAHAVGYVHRDLRPRNIFLTRRRGRAGFVKLVDFGLAKLVDREMGAAAATRLGLTFGDARYMSPEHALGEPVDRRADVYSLGCIGYEMLTGEPPFAGDDMEVISKHVEEIPAPVESRAPHTPGWLAAAIARMLAKDPEDRFVTVYRMAEALRLGRETGSAMSGEIAGAIEDEVSASVSQAMEQLTDPGSVPYQVIPRDDGGFEVKTPTPPKRRETSERVASEPSPGHAHDTEPQPRAPLAEAPSGPTERIRPATPTPVPGTLMSADRTIRTGAPKGMLPPTNDEDAAGTEDTPPEASVSSAWFADGETMAQPESEQHERPQAERTETVRRQDADEDESSGWGMWIAGTAVLAAMLGWWVWPGGERRPEVAAADEPTSLVITKEAVEPRAHSEDEVDAVAQAPAAAVADASTPAEKPAITETKPPAAPEPATNSATSPAEDKRSTNPEPSKLATKPKPAKPKDEAAASTATNEPRATSTNAPPVEPEPETTDEVANARPADQAVADEASRVKADFFAKLGESDLRAGRYGTAAKNFHRSLQLDANNTQALTGLGELALAQSSFAAATRHLRRALRQRREPYALTLLGEAHLGAGDRESAADAFKEALRLQPDNPRARSGYLEATGDEP